MVRFHALLPGLAVTGAPEFERWLTAKRERYRRDAADAARRLDLPSSIRPQALLHPADRAARLQAASVRVLAWRDTRLVVRSEGHGWIGPPGEETSRYVTVGCRIALEVGEGGIRELERRC